MDAHMLIHSSPNSWNSRKVRNLMVSAGLELAVSKTALAGLSPTTGLRPVTNDTDAISSYKIGTRHKVLHLATGIG